ncbi:Gfo/Idh/MocA family protein [Alicyclobacillus kakegawensis]|uniref:Gfo/Idh/MocA family protein n=1 Tax=Alicyclobacillus kakegawensis TaxID=392012 RepID=UPI00082EC1B0|nr:Gfo/Idh/MocA family oxidoreductase [Alicyclobacillus kakegawensis]
MPRVHEILDLEYKPKLPKDMSMGIGIVGAGEIVREAHLPAYKIAGFNVVSITDLDTTRAQALSVQYGIPRVYETVEELVADPDIQIVDIAVPAEVQPSIVELATNHGKHVLCQKPLADTFSNAQSIVSMCEQAGVRGAVNCQMRWAPGIQASHTIIKRGWLGDLIQASFQVNVLQRFERWSFLRDIPTLEVMYHSIHYLDSIRYLFGTPSYIFADGSKYPGQVCAGETRTLIHIAYEDERRALIYDNHNNWCGQDDWYAAFRFEGTRGVIKGTNGALYNYPTGREDTMSFISREIDEDYWFTPRLTGRWFPHAFIGTMGELMIAIEEDREPVNSVRDGLETLQMVFAAYKSMDERRAVWLHEITG